MRLLLYLVYALMALAYAVLTPPGEAPDEMPHLQHVDFLLHERRIPHRLRDHVYQDHHPPLYYATAAAALGLGQWLDPRAHVDLPGPFAIHVDLAAPALDRDQLERGRAMIPPALRSELEAKANLKPRHFRITRGQFLVVRLWSWLLALGTLVLVHQTARLVLPSRSGGPTIALAFAALLPQFQFLGGVINCDIMAIFTGNLLLFALARHLVAGTLVQPVAAVVVGVALALCLLAKMSGIAMVVPVVVAYGFAARLAGWRRAGTHLAVSLAVAFVAGGWWYGLNFVRYGDPFMVDAQAATMGEQIHQPPLHAHYFAEYLFETVRSFFGNLGPLAVPIPTWLFYAYVGLVGLALVGLVLRWTPKRPIAELPPGGRAALWVAACGLLATWFVVFRGNLTFYSFQGRYLYPGLAAVAAGVGLGLVEALHPGRLLRVAGGLLLVAMALYTFAFRFLPEYYGLRSRCEQPLVVRTINAGHPRLGSGLAAGEPIQTWCAFGSRLDPDATAARGSPVVFHLDNLPVAEPLVLRVRFGEYIRREPRSSYPLQDVTVNGVLQAGALVITPRAREIAFPVPPRPDAANVVDLVLKPVPGYGDFATVSEVRIERAPLCPTGLVVTRASASPGESIEVELTVENLHPDRTGHGRLGLTLTRDSTVVWLEPHADLDLEPGASRTLRLRPRIPRSWSPGRAVLRAFLSVEPAAPFVDINPCITTPSDGRLVPDPEAFGRYAVQSSRPEESPGASKSDSARLRVQVPFPPAPPGRYDVQIGMRQVSPDADGTIQVLKDGRPATTPGAGKDITGNPHARWRTLAWRLDWAGGPGEIVVNGRGDLRVDRIRLVPVWVPAIHLMAFPHESIVDVK